MYKNSQSSLKIPATISPCWSTCQRTRVDVEFL